MSKNKKIIIELRVGGNPWSDELRGKYDDMFFCEYAVPQPSLEENHYMATARTMEEVIKNSLLINLDALVKEIIDNNEIKIILKKERLFGKVKELKK